MQVAGRINFVQGINQRCLPLFVAIYLNSSALIYYLKAKHLRTFSPSVAAPTVLMLLLPHADEEQHAYGHAQERKRKTEHRARTINLRHVWIGGDRERGALNCPHAEPDSCCDEEKQQRPAKNYERVRHDIAPALKRRPSNGPNARPDLLRNRILPDCPEYARSCWRNWSLTNCLNLSNRTLAPVW